MAMLRLSAIWLSLGCVFSLGAVELVRDGQPVAEIVVDATADSSVRVAGRELQKYLKRMSGAGLPIVAQPGERTPIYVGASPYTSRLGITLDDVRDDGFKIVVGDAYVALLGYDQCRPAIPRENTSFGARQQALRSWQESTGKPWDYPYIVRDPRNFCPDLGFHFQDANGTLSAVYEFLEQLGMRWFMPIEDLGQVIPERRDISLSPMTLKREPDFASRYLLLVGMGRNPQEFLWYKYLKQGGVFDQFLSHSSELVAEFQQDRPELMAFADGKPIPTGRRRYAKEPRYLPRLSSPELRAELAEYLVRFHDAFPEVPYLPIGQPDGWVALDDRDVAAGWDRLNEGHDGRFSDYTWDFVLDVANRVRQQRPGLRFSTSSYGCARVPPKLVGTIPADIAIAFSQNSTLPGFATVLARRNEWLAKAPGSDFLVYDYYLSHYPPRPVVPVPAIFTAQMEENFSNLPDRCRGIYTELSWSPTRQHDLVVGLPGLNHLMIYLHAKLTWNRDLDVKATLADYYETFYGPAQAEMREFFEYAESVWMRPGSREITAFGGFLKPDDVPKYFEILARAEDKAGVGIYGRRIAFIAEEMAPLRNLFSELHRTGPYVRAFVPSASPTVDGDLNKPFWTSEFAAEKVWLRDCATGVYPNINTTSVAFRWLPDSSLLVGITCHERRMNRLHAATPATATDDQGIYHDDTVELHLETPAGYRAVVVANPNGAVRDTCTGPDTTAVPEAWSASQVAVRKLDDCWTLEIMIKDLGPKPDKSFPWGINVFRLRLAGGEEERYALSPTGTGSFLHAASKMGSLYVR